MAGMSPILRQWPWAALLASAAMLAIAHAFEIFGHLPPCTLCYREREVYWAALTIAVVGVIGGLFSLNTRWTHLISLVLALVFLCGAGLAAYHAGAEWGFWPGPSTCAGGSAHVGAADLASLLKSSRIAPPACDKAAWVFLGLSMAGWNALISLGLAALSGLAVRERGRA
jgi:disulfide bond formation protein DsbB